MASDLERLNKILAQLGVGSRRSVDILIAEKRVFVNGAPAELGQKVDDKALIVVDGKPVNRRPIEKVVLAFNKPRGVTTTKKDPYAKVTIMDFLPPQYHHLYPVGRLDRDSRGLLLLTNNGDLALQLEHPSFQHAKEYAVIVAPLQPRTAAVFSQDLKRLEAEIIDSEYQSKPVKVIHHEWDGERQQGYVTLVLEEGKKRQIRGLFAALGYSVIDLCRTRVGQVTLANLREGEYRVIDPAKIV